MQMQKNWNWTQHEHEEQHTPSRQPSGNSHQASTAQHRRPGTSAVSSMMPATPYFMPLFRFYQDMDRMFEQAFRQFGLPSAFGAQTQPEATFSPHMDISLTDKEYTIEIEAPGMREDDIRLNVTYDGQLCICGEKRQTNEKQEKDFQRVERSYGAFSRTLALPEDVDQENIQADFTNGILTITLPRMEMQALQTRRIQVVAKPSDRQEGHRQEGNRQDANRQDSNRSDANRQDANRSEGLHQETASRQNTAAGNVPKRAA